MNKAVRKIWIHKVNSFEEAEYFEQKYYSNMSSSQRLEIVQLLRERYFKIKKQSKHEGRKRLRRSIKIIQ